MTTRPYVWISIATAVAMCVFAFVTAERLPADTMLPTHWNAAGEPDRFSPAIDALLFPAGLVVFITILAIIPRIEPLQDRLEGSAPVLRATWLGLLATMLVIQAAIGLPAYGIELPANTVMLAVGLLLVVLGNALPKSRPGFFVGIRTPWAIIDADNWIATHRLGGKLMMVAGLAIALASLLPIGPQATSIVTIAAIVVAASVPYLYSWWLWRSVAGTKSE